MNSRLQIIRARFVITGLLAGAAFVGLERSARAAEPPVDPVHAAHVASGAMPPDAAKPDPALLQKLSELQTKLAQLEAAVAKNAPPSAAVPASGAMPGMAAPAASMPGMSGGVSPATNPAGGMAGMTPPPGGAMNMMGMMDQMMGMMDKMMPKGGGAMPAAAAPMAGGMGKMKDEMSGVEAGAMPPAAPAMSDMGMDQMGMAGMMGMGAMPSGAAGKMQQSALPGFPGASHLYHIGATDFFLDHPQHIALSIEQQAALNKAKEQAVLAKTAADRAVAQGEQELWTLTASDQPDAAKIDAKIREIEKLRGDERLDFIRAVGEAAKVLTEEQRQSLLGLKPAQPKSMPGMPAAPAGPMKDM